jgi:ring-1,2-phenylacetyl-CoA epoxidase subunit PaaC
MTDVNDDLLCVADTKLVLGNWFAECVMNGRSLPDFAAMLGMCTASYGQARAIYQHLAPGQEAYAELERGRGPAEIRSMQLLDVPPQNWEDLVMAAYLAEQSSWALMSSLLATDDRAVAAIARKIGEEAYFHLKYATGWFKVIASDVEGAERLQDSLARRIVLARDWFGADDPGGGVMPREGAMGGRALADGFIRNVERDLAPLGFQVPSEPAGGHAIAGSWDQTRRRRDDLPAGLFEVIRFKNPEYAH